jgi:hypothetical protein
LKAFGSVTMAAMVVAPTMQMPGIGLTARIARLDQRLAGLKLCRQHHQTPLKRRTAVVTGMEVPRWCRGD